MERSEHAIRHEDGLALFLTRELRPRWREALGHERLRTKLVRRLSHFDQLDPRFTELVPSNRRRSAHLGPELERRGAGSSCHVVSEDSDLDGREMSLKEALTEVVDFGSFHATFISCVPGKLAYFHDEPPHENDYILDRRNVR